MAERVVTLRVNVQDGEVVAATASLNRMKAAANDVGGGGAAKGLKEIETGAQAVDRAAAKAAQRLGISYDQMIAKIKAAGIASKGAATGIAAADKAMTQTTEAASDLGDASEGAAAGLGSLAGKAGPVGAIITGVVLVLVAAGAAAYKLGKEIFELTKQFADYAAGIGKAAEETGLAARTVAGLTAEAERQGRSFNSLKSPIENFRKVIGEAAGGSEEARAKLNLLGLDAQTAGRDITGAFASMVATITQTKDPLEQAKLGFAAFGPEFYKILPFFREFNGNVPETIRRAEELGIAIGETDVKAAKEFNRAYADVQKVILGLKNVIGSEFLPIVVDVFKEFTGWVVRNKAEITGWASDAANGVRGVIQALRDLKQFMDDNPAVVTIALGNAQLTARFLSTQGAAGVAQLLAKYGEGVKAAQQIPPAIDDSRPQSAAIDPAVLDAMRKAQEDAAKQRQAAAAKDLDALIKLFDRDINAAGKAYDDLFKKITDQFKETANPQQYQEAFEKLDQWYADVINGLAGQWSDLVQKRTLSEVKGENERFLIYKETQDRIDQLSQRSVDSQDSVSKAIREQQKKAAADYLKDLESAMNRAIELNGEQGQTTIAQAQRDFDIRIVSERQMVDQINKIELDALAFRKAELQKYLKEVIGIKDAEGKARHDLAVLDEKIAQQQITNSNRILDVERKKQEAIEELRKAYEDWANSLEDQIVVLSRGNRPLTAYEQTLRDIQRNYKDLNPVQKQHLLDLAAQVDILEELNRQHAELKDFFAETFSYVFEGDFQGAIDSISRRFRQSFIEDISSFFASQILGFDPNATDNPVAKPIVGKIEKTNQILNAILGRLGGTPVTGGGLGSLGSIFSGLLSGVGNVGTSHEGIHSGMGPGGTPYFNPNAGGIGGLSGSGGGGGLMDLLRRVFGIRSGSLDGIDVGSGGFDPATGTYSNPTGGGGLFGSLSSGIGTIGQIGVLAGGMIGGRVGSVISNVAGGALAGLALGAKIGAIGGPIGAAIGAGVGFLAAVLGGLFSSPKRKRDKEENIPALNRGFTEAMKQLNEILAGVRNLSIDPEEAVSRAGQVRAEIASGFGIRFESNKYQKEARKLIAAKLTQADTIIGQISAASEIARGAADRRQRILPEFAGGHYFADFFRPNGLVPGAFDGADNILAMISRGEMVINPRQQNRVRSLAGFDVFAGAGIPNYPQASSSPKLAMGGIAGAGLSPAAAQIVDREPHFTIVLPNVVPLDDRIEAYTTSDRGKRTMVKVIRDQSGLRRI